MDIRAIEKHGADAFADVVEAGVGEALLVEGDELAQKLFAEDGVDLIGLGGERGGQFGKLEALADGVGGEDDGQGGVGLGGDVGTFFAEDVDGGRFPVLLLLGPACGRDFIDGLEDLGVGVGGGFSAADEQGKREEDDQQCFEHLGVQYRSGLVGWGRGKGWKEGGQECPPHQETWPAHVRPVEWVAYGESD